MNSSARDLPAWHRARVLVLVASVLIPAAFAGRAAGAAPTSKPNIVFVITDDQGYGDLGFTGNPVVKTIRTDPGQQLAPVFLTAAGHEVGAYYAVVTKLP